MLFSTVVTQLIGGLLPTLVTSSILVLGSLFAPRLRVLRPLQSLFARVSQRRALALALVAVLSLAVVSGVTKRLGFPVPKAHDEFSYLLAADTFSHGRITNPTHPMWPHFETLHVIHRPTYMSKYPPGQGLALAMGQLLGHPIIGAWLSTAAACVAVAWALFAWFPSRWAFLGALLAPLHPMILLWSQSYWGGSVALIGGALVAGAIRRLGDIPRARDGWMLAIGIAILANSRPYEGLLVTVLAVAALIVRSAGKLPADQRAGSPTILAIPFVIVGIVTAAAMAYYNNRITGDPLLMPYIAHERQYGVTPIFIFQDLRPTKPYRHLELKRYHVDWSVPFYQDQRTARGFIEEGIDNMLVMIRGAFRLFVPTIDGRPVTEDLGFFPRWFSGILILPFAALPAALRRDRWLRAAAWIVGLFALGLLPLLWVVTHYASPVAPFAYILLIAGMRQLAIWRPRGRPAGQVLLTMILAAWILSFFVSCWILARPESPQWVPVRYRAAFVEALEKTGDRHLIVVRYSPQHFIHFEWVYNQADIDGAAVVWARDMGERENQRLAEYFRDRKVWLLHADARRLMLLPYTPRGS